MYEKILVPLDGSTLAEGILPQVKYLAGLTGAEVCLLQVVEVRTFPGVDRTEAEVEASTRADTYLGQLAEGLAGGIAKVSTHVRYGSPAAEILDHAKDVDLVAMSTHGRTGLGRWALGSVADKVLNHCPKPVLLGRCGEQGVCEIP